MIRNTHAEPNWKDKFVKLPLRQSNIFRMSVNAQIQQNLHDLQTISFRGRKIYSNPHEHEYNGYELWS